MKGRPALVALASIPTRAHFLPRVLASLRPQADRIAVYLNGYREVPVCVRELADEHVLDPENSGAERKLWFAQDWDGLYFSCDDDFAYPLGYVSTMVDALERWNGGALVTAHGRTYLGQPSTIYDVTPGSRGIVHHRIAEGAWVNCGGTGCMAWDAAQVRVPREWPQRNMLDLQLAVWAQRERVPMWLIPHPAHWLESFATQDPQGIWHSSKREGHRRRNGLLRRHGSEHGWELFTVDA